jgi:hypothetical protein
VRERARHEDRTGGAAQRHVGQPTGRTVVAPGDHDQDVVGLRRGEQVGDRIVAGEQAKLRGRRPSARRDEPSRGEVRLGRPVAR